MTGIEQLDVLVAEAEAKLTHWKIIRELACYQGHALVDVVKNSHTKLLESIRYTNHKDFTLRKD